MVEKSLNSPTNVKCFIQLSRSWGYEWKTLPHNKTAYTVPSRVLLSISKEERRRSVSRLAGDGGKLEGRGFQWATCREAVRGN